LKQATITVVAHQITANPTAIFDPYGDITGVPNPPSVVVADYWCTSAQEGCAFDQDGPDLAVPETPSAGVSPTRVRAGGMVTFPLGGVSIQNVGTQTAGPHRYGIYLSTAATVASIPRSSDGTIQENPNGPGVVTRLANFGDLAEVLASASELIAAQGVTIPADIPRLNADGTGTYYLYLYVDDRRRVNELDEENNIVQGGPITIDPAGYTGILGLFSPCSGLTCKKKTGSAFPLAFQLTFDGVTAVDSEDTQPRFKVYAPVGGACRTSFPADGSGFLFLADPTDASSGSSLWQYFTVAGSRPAFTWQYNFQGKDPATGASLPIGCYSFVVEVPSMSQTIGSAGPVTRLSITLTK
jgi:hypothetical protein